MAKGEIKKESKGKPKKNAKDKAVSQSSYAYVPAEVITKKKDKDK
jgi:hypothetical protein